MNVREIDEILAGILRKAARSRQLRVQTFVGHMSGLDHHLDILDYVSLTEEENDVLQVVMEAENNLRGPFPSPGK